MGTPTEAATQVTSEAITQTGKMIASGDPNALNMLLFTIMLISAAAVVALFYMIMRFTREEIKSHKERNLDLEKANDALRDKYQEKLEGLVKQIQDAEIRDLTDRTRDMNNLVTQMASMRDALSQVLGAINARSFHQPPPPPSNIGGQQ